MNREIIGKLKNFLLSGRMIAFYKAVLFLNFAFITGLWMGIKLFFPDDFILSKINKELFVKDLGLISENISISLFGNISFNDGAILEKGSKVATFQKLKFSPSLTDLIRGNISGDVYVKDINNLGGEIKISFDLKEHPCYSISAEEMPLSVLQPLMKETSFTGNISGDGNVCADEQNKFSGKIDFKGFDIVFRGKIPTAFGDFDVGKINLGEIELFANIIENKVEIENFLLNGILNLDIKGKITLNPKIIASSRLDIDLRAKIPDMAKIAENPALNLLISQMAQYKTDNENNYALMLRGFLSKPQMNKAPKERISVNNLNEIKESGKRKNERRIPRKTARKLTEKKPKKPEMENKQINNEKIEIKKEIEPEKEIEEKKEPEPQPEINKEPEHESEHNEQIMEKIPASENTQSKKEEESNDNEKNDN